MAVNPDLAKERTRATFDPEKLTEVIYNGRDVVRRRRYLQNVVFQDKYLQSFKPSWNCDRLELYEDGLRKNVYLLKLMDDMGIKDFTEQVFISEAASSHEANPLGIHKSMFLPTIEKQGTDEQKAKYIPLINSFKILGTYAQTELGHGTFIRGLETTATYHPEAEEFVIDSPTLTSMKYWPAALGRTATHAVVMAQLITQGKRCGLQAFVVQLRSLKDHKLLPGVETGDIGNKFGFNSMDNGYLKFDKIRISRDSMLMRYSKVTKDGTFTKSPNDKIAYGTMIYIRAMIVGVCGKALANVCTIATRYSAVRRQTEASPGGEELQIIDYQTQQQKLFPYIAASYALIFVGKEMTDTYLRISRNIDQGDLDELPMLHALSSGLKALSSYTANFGIEVLRMACGGHGYTHASGIPKIYANTTPNCTYEGENTVLYLQTARYLMKCAAKAAAGESLPGFMTYLNNTWPKSSPITASLEFRDLVDAYEHRAARMIKSVASKLQKQIQSGKSIEEARNMVSIDLVKVAEAHSQIYVVKTFTAIVTRPDLDPAVAKVMGSLCRLYAVYGMTQSMGDFILDGYISSSQAEMLTSRLLDLYATIRPDAVALVDAFDYPDQVLGSCIGRYDGRVYEALYEYAKASPLNVKDVMDVHNEIIKPMMEGRSGPGSRSSRL